MSQRIAAGMLSLALAGACSVTTPRDAALTLRNEQGALGERSDLLQGPDGLDQGPSPVDRTDSVGGDGLDADGSRAADSAPLSGPGQGSDRTGGAGGGTGGSARQSAVGVTADTVVVSASYPFSGPLGQIYEQIYSTAIVTWAEDTNERGGIHGRKIVLKKVDNKGTVDGQIAACREVQSNGSFVVLLGGSVGDAEADCLDERGFPAMHSTAETRSPKWTSIRAVVSSESARTLGSFIQGPLGGAGKKVGIIHTENYTGYRDAAVDGIKEAGFEIVRVERVASNQGSFTSELLRLRDAGAGVVVILTAQEAIGILRDARAISYSPIWTGMPWPADELSLAAGELMNGIKGLRMWTTTDTKAWREFRALVAKHDNGTAISGSMALYGSAVVLRRALELAGPVLTRETLRQGFDSMTSFDPGLVPAVNFSGGRVVGSRAQFPVRCCNTNREFVGLGPATDRF